MYPQYSNVVTVGTQSASYPYWYPLNAQGAGTSRITAASTEYPYDSFGDLRQFYAQAQAQVTGPNHIRVLTDNHGFPQACPATGVYVRQIQAQVVDSSNRPITTNIPIAEAFSNMSANTCGTGSPVPASCSATAGGQFIDTMTVSGNFCGSGIQQNSGCGFTHTSTWSACGNGFNNNIWTSPRSTQSNGITVNGNSTPPTNGFPAGTQLYP
jgi:hypothetical protein